MTSRGGWDEGSAGWMEEYRPRICKTMSCVLWFFGAPLVQREMGCGSARMLVGPPQAAWHQAVLALHWHRGLPSAQTPDMGNKRIVLMSKFSSQLKQLTLWVSTASGSFGFTPPNTTLSVSSYV